ncbi:MAG: 50S ribosomal protein L29 [Patescibacteria group bacterium]
MAKKEKIDTASAGLEGITSTLVKLESELYTLSMKQQFGELKETHKLKQLRKDIARSKTEMRAHTI